MDATARWPAVRYLRSWEWTHLALQRGERIVDVGCGPGDVTIALCTDVGAAGRVLGLDASTAMLDVALRPGGRVLVADTDWRSLMFDLIEPDMHDAVTAAFRAIRGPGYDVGGKLLNRCRDLGLVDVDITAATQVWTHWDPDADDPPTGFFPLRIVMEQLGDHGMIDRVMADRFVVAIEDAARRDRLFCALTMFAVYGRRPA